MEAVSLQNLIKDIAHGLQEIVESATTANSLGTNEFVDSNFSNTALFTTNEWNGSQVIFEEPAYTSGGNINPGPHVITGFSTSTFTSNRAFRSSGVVATGLNYFLIRPRGQGSPYNSYLAAIRYALDRLGVMTRAKNNALVTAAETYDYTIPAGLGWVNEVRLTKTGYAELVLTSRQWSMRPGRGIHVEPELNVGGLYTLNLYGYTEDVLPSTLDATVVCERVDVVDLALERMRANRFDSSDNSRADRQTQERVRFRRMAPPPNLRRVLP